MADHQSLSNHRVRSLAQVAGLEPTAGLQYGLRVTRTGSISLAGYFTMASDSGEVSYRRSFRCTCRPAGAAMLSWHELPGNPGQSQRTHEILDEADTLDGIDGLGVLRYGHARNACRSVSRLSVEETGKLASDQNAAGLQATSARLTDRPFGIHIPNGPGARPSAAGIVEADPIDFARCLQLQRPYPGPVEGHFTTCTPLTGRSPLLPQDIDPTIRGSSEMSSSTSRAGRR